MIDFVKNLIAPPRCAGCGMRMSVFDEHSDKAFCDKCRGKWERVKRTVCSGCSYENADCVCKLKLIKNTRILSLIKFTQDPACDRLIYAMKKRRNKRIFDFASDELYKRLVREEKMLFADFSRAVFTNVPRNAKSKNLYGFDQAELLAVAVSEKMGGEYKRLLLRRYGGRVQKKLGEDKRHKNVQNRFVFNKSENIKGKTVVLIDDVVTTGATASECIKVLREGGAAEVILLTLARSENKNKKERRK